jgi:hypothetical protein
MLFGIGVSDGNIELATFRDASWPSFLTQMTNAFAVSCSSSSQTWATRSNHPFGISGIIFTRGPHPSIIGTRNKKLRRSRPPTESR